MKRKAFTLCVATLVFAAMLSSCKKKENGDEKITTFYATTDSEGSKTDLNGGTVLWTNGDAVKVFNADGTASATFTLSTGAGTSTGTFTGEIAESATYYGVYPNGANHSFANSKLTVNIPQTQTYRANNFSLGSATMVAQTTGTTMNFKHVCGGIAIDLVAGQAASITSIEVTALGNEPLYGDFEVNSSTGEIVSSANGGSTTTLTCSPAVALDDTDDTRFYIMLPAQTYTGGLKVEFKNGSVTVCTKNIATSGVTIPRATIKTLQQLDVNPAEPGAPVITSITPRCPGAYTVSCATNVSSAGSGNLVTVGFCWTTTASEASTVTKGPNNYYEETSSTGFTPGDFHFDITGMQSATTYYIRSYAINSDDGITYSGSNISISTFDEPPMSLGQGSLSSSTSTNVLSGKFTVAPGRKVSFTKSNLRYNPYQKKWSIGSNQYDEGKKDLYTSTNHNVSANYVESYDGYITFFGFGTSGWYANNTYYKPWQVATDITDPAVGYGYGPLGCSTNGTPEFNLRRDLVDNQYGDFSNSDWGIYNSTNHDLRTLTSDEWQYLINYRDNATTKRGICVIYTGTDYYWGYIILPDDFTLPDNVTNWYPSDGGTTENTYPSSSLTGNYYNAAQWTKMQANGAVFLPCNGYREGTNIKGYGASSGGISTSTSYYWTSTTGNSGYAIARPFGTEADQEFNVGSGRAAKWGCYVRLVKDVN